ncbi:MAG: response regulator [Magnetococcales bacterium]|nr:response regulator [Magnetococcales bacterium]MBF0261631.1 response regulator [Magnetococcales bacterium]
MNPILIVDDDPDFCQVVIDVLTKAGFPTVRAGSGHEALAVLRNTKCDIVLLDLVLPGMDGLEVLRRIHEQDEHVKVILITAFATIENAVNSIKMGATEFLTKPFRINDFTTMIHRTIEEIRFEAKARELNLDPLLASLSHPIRRGIADALNEREELRLTDLMQLLAITDHTKLTFHLKNLMEHGIIDKNRNRGYILTQQGRMLLSGLRRISMSLGVNGHVKVG